MNAGHQNQSVLFSFPHGGANDVGRESEFNLNLDELKAPGVAERKARESKVSWSPLPIIVKIRKLVGEGVDLVWIGPTIHDASGTKKSREHSLLGRR